RWNKNADDIAAFLNQANPKNWSVNDMRKMLHEHLQLINEVVELRAGGHYADDIAHYDKVQRQMLKIAHVLSAGMTNQFPDKASPRPYLACRSSYETSARSNSGRWQIF